ncbi:MAG: type II toxin-antitoxin system VapC family toxin [Balneolaceae bacterium]
MYIDTSSLVAFYVPEKNTDIVNSIVMNSELVQVSTLTHVEFISAVNKKFRIGTMTKKEVTAAIDEFERQVLQKIITELDFEHQHFDSAAMILKQTSYPLRTLDALHLAICFINKSSILSFDRVLVEAAKEFDIKAIEY